MSKSWTFAIMSDVSTHDFGNSHLDVRIWIPDVEFGYDLLSFHLLAIPLFKESHTWESLFNFSVKVFDALYLMWKNKLIGLSTYEAPNMTGCNVGFIAACHYCKRAGILPNIMFGPSVGSYHQCRIACNHWHVWFPVHEHFDHNHRLAAATRNFGLLNGESISLLHQRRVDVRVERFICYRLCVLLFGWLSNQIYVTYNMLLSVDA